MPTKHPRLTALLKEPYYSYALQQAVKHDRSLSNYIAYLIKQEYAKENPSAR